LGPAFLKGRKFLWSLSAIALFGLGLTLLLALAHHRIADKEERIIPVVDPKADITIGQVHQVSSRGGRKEWELDATSAKLLEEEKKLWLQELQATFFLEDGGTVHLTADEGFIQTETNDIEVIGNVVLKNKEFRLTTERLTFDNKKRVVSSKTRVKITDGASNLFADSLVYNMNTKKSLLEGNVVGILRDQKLF
jgi:LPS export ABC transporter protein LptC